jgi:outer membrane protein TolC
MMAALAGLQRGFRLRRTLRSRCSPGESRGDRKGSSRGVLLRGSALACLAIPAIAQAQQTLTVIPGDSSPLTLAACIEQAREHNETLRAEQLRMGEVRALITQSISEAFPTIDASGTWNRSRDPSFALDETFSGDAADFGGPDSLFAGFLPEPEQIPAQTFWRASVNATWDIRPGRIYNALHAIGSGISQQREAIVETEQFLAEEVMRAYSSVFLAAERESALVEEATARQELLEIARRRLRVELGTPLDTLQAAVSLANLRPEIRQARQSVQDAGGELNVLMGRDPSAPLALRGEPELEQGDLDPGQFEERIGERPDLRRREYEIEVLRRTRGARKALHHPYLSMDGSYGYVGRDISSMTDPGHDFWSARIGLVVPLFDGMLTRGQVKETEAQIARARVELSQAQRDALRGAVSLHGRWMAARQSLAAAELNERLAEEALEETQKRYELGKADYLAVLNAQAERHRARSNAIEARHEVVTSLASLKRALGFDPRTSLAEIEREMEE